MAQQSNSRTPLIQRCNVCEKMTSNDKSLALFFANCGHLICEDCGITDKCPFCGKETNYVKIDDKLPEHLKMFLQDPGPMIRKWGKIVEFQNMQSGIVIQQLQQQKKSLQQKVNQLKNELKDKSKDIEHWKAKCSNLEIELDRKNEMFQDLTRVNEINSGKKKFCLNVGNSNFFDTSQKNEQRNFFDHFEINNFEQKKDDAKKSATNQPAFKLMSDPSSNLSTNPPSTLNQTVKSASLPRQSDPLQQSTRQKSKKLTFDNLDDYLK